MPLLPQLLLLPLILLLLLLLLLFETLRDPPPAQRIRKLQGSVESSKTANLEASEAFLGPLGGLLGASWVSFGGSLGGLKRTLEHIPYKRRGSPIGAVAFGSPKGRQEVPKRPEEAPNREK